MWHNDISKIWNIHSRSPTHWRKLRVCFSIFVHLNVSPSIIFFEPVQIWWSKRSSSSTWWSSVASSDLKLLAPAAVFKTARRHCSRIYCAWCRGVKVGMGLRKEPGLIPIQNQLFKACLSGFVLAALWMSVCSCYLWNDYEQTCCCFRNVLYTVTSNWAIKD